MRQLPEKGLKVRRAANLLVSITPDIQKGGFIEQQGRDEQRLLKKKT